MKQAILISTGLLLTTPFIHAEKNKDKKPNVVFILADDLGYGDPLLARKRCKKN